MDNPQGTQTHNTTFKVQTIKNNKTQNIMNNIHEFKNIPHDFLFFPLSPKRH